MVSKHWTNVWECIAAGSWLWAPTWPSVEAEKHSVPVLDWIQMVLYAGSRWLCSMGVSSTGCEPFRVSQYATWPLYWPPSNTWESLGLYSRETRGETGFRVISALLGFSGLVRWQKQTKSLTLKYILYSLLKHVTYIYCKFTNLCEGFIWWISWPSLNRKNKYHANNSST